MPEPADEPTEPSEPSEARWLLRTYRRSTKELNEAQGLIALAGLAFVVMVAFFTYRQMRSAEHATEAALDAANMQRRSSVMHDRAWLVVEAQRFPMQFEAGTKHMMEWKLKNVGQLPALDVRVRIKQDLAGANEPFNLDPNRVQRRAGTLGSRTTLGPGQEKPLQGHMQLSADELQQVMQGSKRVYAYGEVLYSYPGDGDGSLTVCVYYDPQYKTWMDCDIFNDVR